MNLRTRVLSSILIGKSFGKIVSLKVVKVSNIALPYKHCISSASDAYRADKSLKIGTKRLRSLSFIVRILLVTSS